MDSIVPVEPIKNDKQSKEKESFVFDLNDTDVLFDTSIEENAAQVVATSKRKAQDNDEEPVNEEKDERQKSISCPKCKNRNDFYTFTMNGRERKRCRKCARTFYTK